MNCKKKQLKFKKFFHSDFKFKIFFYNEREKQNIKKFNNLCHFNEIFFD